MASAAGPRKSGSDSIELHSETQQPQLMQSDSLWIDVHRSCETTFSFSVVRSRRGSRYGWIARIFCQNGSMSTTRSLTIGRFPIAEITGTCPSRGDVRDARLAGEHGAAVDPHAAGAADHHPAALAVRQRAVDLVFHGVERVEQRRLVGARRSRTAGAHARPSRRRSARSSARPSRRPVLVVVAVRSLGAPQPTTRCQFYRLCCRNEQQNCAKSVSNACHQYDLTIGSHFVMRTSR